MEDHKFAIGQKFPDVKAFRTAVKEAAIAQHFELRIIKSDLIRYFAKCSSEGCPWRIRAAKLPHSPVFTIRSLESTHTCGKNAQNGHHQASVDWIVTFIEHKLRENIDYKPKDILRDIHKEYGITIPYKQAWRAKERGLAAIYGSSEEGFCVLPLYCEQMRSTNPGSVAEVYTSSDNRFQRMFISFYSSIYGFLNGCLPVVCVGKIELKSKYLGTLISATSFDSDGGVFLVAFGIVDVENDESWIWFMSELQGAFESNVKPVPPITFMVDVQNGVVDAVRRQFPGSCCVFCMRHFSETIGKEFKNPRLVNLLWKAAYATSITSFREKIAEIEEASPEAAKWILRFPPSCWSLAYSEGMRYGYLSSNIDEFSKWVSESRELPIIEVIERIHSKLQTEFEERRNKSSAWFSTLIPSVEKRLADVTNSALTFQVLRSDNVEFEVISGDRSNVVNIGTRRCSCRGWQLYGIPCSHAVATLILCREDISSFTDKRFTVESYRETYVGQINPVPARSEWRKTREAFRKGEDEDDDEEDDIRVVRPPKFRRPPGRPEKKRLCTEETSREKHTVRCSRCNQTGHYKTTCKAEIVKIIEQC